MKMDLATKLKEDGWHLSNEAVQSISENGAITNLHQLHKKALDLDLREISEPFFPEDIAKGKLESVAGNVVVQVQKVRNISAPKANEESQAAPRMLKILFTDGHTVCHGIEIETINSFSLNTPPGTKVLLKGENLQMDHGLLLLHSNWVQVLGGKVSVLIEKWELNRTLAKHTRRRIGEEGGPPSWIPFGQKLQQPNLPDKSFKSLGEAAVRENTEFEAQRQDAIAEAARGGARKVFGGGHKPIVDRNVKTIMDMGFSQEQAEQALRQTRNNCDRALQNLQRRTGGGLKAGGSGSGKDGIGGKNGVKEERERERGGRRRGERDEEGGSGPKPSGQVSLFAFLEDKLPTTIEKDDKENDKGTASSGYNYSSGNQRNQSSFQRGRQDRNSYRGNSQSSSFNNSSESRNRDDRNRSINNSVIQKPPRFQNQQHQQQRFDSYQSWPHSDHSHTGYNNRNLNDSNNDLLSRRNQPLSYSNKEPSFDYSRNNRSSNSSSGQKNNAANLNYCRQMMEAGMPEIPDFPFKDASALPSLLTNNPPPYFHNNSGAHQPRHHQPYNMNGEAQPPAWQWKIGDKCMAKYWEDNMYYNAEVTGLSKKTCVVRFLEYGNFEEVLQDDCLPITEESVPSHQNNSSSHHSSNNRFSGVIEFRRGGSRPYIKSGDSNYRKNQQRNPQQVYVPPAQRKD